MPCNQIRYTSVEFKHKHRALLIESLKQAGWTVTLRPLRPGQTEADRVIYIHSPEGNRIILTGETARAPEGKESVIDEAKVVYAKACVMVAAERLGYTAEIETGETEDQESGKRVFRGQFLKQY